MEKTIILLKVLVTVCSVTFINASNMILGTQSGNIYICQENHLDDCLVLFNGGSGVSINALAVSKDFLYAGLSSGTILRCERETQFNCGTLYDGDSPIHSIVIPLAGDYIYAGLNSGLILQCNKYEANNCTVFYTHDAPIRSLAISDIHIYVGIETKQILRCDLTPNSCGYFQQSGASINALALSNNYLFAGLEAGTLWRCDRLLINSCGHFNDLDGSINSLAITYGYIYVGLGTNLLRCSLIIPNSCQQLTVRYDDSEVLSIAVVTNGTLWSFSNSNNLLGSDTKFILKSLVKKYLTYV